LELLKLKCFYNPTRDAVGVCKNCGKGLCADCAVDVGNGIACKGNCEIRVKGINSAVMVNVRTQKTITIFYGTMGLVLIMFGLIFLYYYPRTFNIILSIGSFVAGFVMFIIVIRRARVIS